ncbi:hypothetical protein GALMADRAFT_71644 [Galerina marginata CBS 339.88]|uniref:Uncharacterized protein n=1 Tax=Galerina marginata (strain CBS 339.88) TaxID=685588 RepID=A0A067T4E9_GALM3|nr:hypothetical protein GALMADRAFT_71644 [Galerina marginata CBS 339.88]
MVHASRLKQAKYFEEENAKKVIRENFKPGSLVMIRNTPVEYSLDKKTKPRFNGPYVVIRKTKGGSYICAEMDGTVSLKRFAAFRLRHYFTRQHIDIPEHILSLSQDEINRMAYETVPEDGELEI